MGHESHDQKGQEHEEKPEGIAEGIHEKRVLSVRQPADPRASGAGQKALLMMLAGPTR